MQIFELYVNDFNKQTICITLNDVINMLNITYEDLFKLSKENMKHFYKNLSFNEYLYLCTLYNIEDDTLKKKYQNKLDFIKPLVEYVKYSSKIINSNTNVLKTVDLEKFDFIPNSSIIYKMYSNMNESYTKEERLFYYYFKLANILKIDTKVNFLKMANRPMASTYRKKFERLHDINLDNNEVTCFEFVEILKYFMKQEKVLCSHYNLDNYGTDKHVILDVISNNNYISFDSFTNDIPNDMINAKLGYDFKGIKIVSSDSKLSRKVKNVYNDVLKEFKKEPTVKYNSYYLHNSLDAINNSDISRENKLRAKDVLFSICNISLTGIEFAIEALNRLKDKCSKDVYPVVVCDTSNGYGFSVIIAVKKNNKEYMYLRFNDDFIEVHNKKQIEEMLNENTLIVCNKRKILNNKIQLSYNYIPGIDEKIQIEGSNNAKKTILRQLIDEINSNDNKQKKLYK